MKKIPARLAETLTLLLIGSFFAGCSSQTEPVSRAAAPVPTPRPATPETPEVLATIDGAPITLADLEERVGDQLASMESQYLRQRQQLLHTTTEQIVFDRLVEGEAAKRGMDKEKLIAEIDSAIEVTPADVNAWYEGNKDRVGGRPLETISVQIQQFLVESQRQKARYDFGKELEKGKEIAYFVGPYRANVEAEDAPTMGPADAPITLVEFSDFECPYCSQFVTTLEEVQAKYGDRVRLVFRHFPLSMHPSAPKAAEASMCANEQDRFWQMHDSMFGDQRQLGVPNLKEKASRLGLDEKAFAECLDSGKYAEQIQKDLQAGTQAGVTGTPALFVNGIPAPSGALPYETVAQFIEDELRRLD